MGLKIPGVGKAIKEFTYSVDLNSDDHVIVIISYHDALNIKKCKCFELRCDERFKTSDAIEKAVKDCLTEAAGKPNIKIREEKERHYVYFGESQFTGNSLSVK